MAQPAVFKILHDLQFKKIGNCKRCRLSQTRTHIVMSSGNPLADLVCVAEGPGEEEDLCGEVLVGPSGRLMNRILETMGRDRTTTFLMNVVKCRACEVVSWGSGKKNRPPAEDEIAACSDFFDEQMNALPNKKLILAFGSVAAHRVLLADQGAYQMWKLRLKYLNSGFVDPKLKTNSLLGGRIPLVVSYHPSYLLRTPEEKIKTYKDIQFAKQYLDATPEQVQNESRFERSLPTDPPRDKSYTALTDTRSYGKPRDFQIDKYSEKLEAL
jgi:uracil-DNA glycosylase